MTLRKFIILTLTLLLPSSLKAEESKGVRPVMASYYLKTGGGQIIDTYLSIIPYKGFEIGAGFENIRTSRFREHKWATRHLLETEFLRALNSRKNSQMLSYMFNYEFDYMRRYTLPCGLRLFVGGNLVADAGTTYTGLGNNPAAAKATIDLGIAAMAMYRLQIKNYPITIKDNLSFPLIGAFICPQFGASYYEMFYLGNREGLIHFGYPGNNLYISNMLTLDLPVKRRSIRIGYECKFRSMHQNHLVYKNFAHEFIFGVAINKVIVGAKEKQLKQEIISLY